MLISDPEIQELIKESARSRKMAYSPYSRFQVGAALLCEDGIIYGGCNVENASYPAGICAERTALSKAISEGKRHFKAVAVVADEEKGKVTAPCGICRQSLAEFGNINVYLSKPDMKTVITTTIQELLPLTFGLGNAFSFNRTIES